MTDFENLVLIPNTTDPVLFKEYGIQGMTTITVFD